MYIYRYRYDIDMDMYIYICVFILFIIYIHICTHIKQSISMIQNVSSKYNSWKMYENVLFH